MCRGEMLHGNEINVLFSKHTAHKFCSTTYKNYAGTT